MNGADEKHSPIKHTTHKVVLPFYIYAAMAFLASTVLLVFSSPAFSQHYFHPHVLAITHAMALGWGTMIILGASYQLVPVLIEAKLFSNWLAYLSFGLAALGIPLLVYAFYVFNIGWPARWGGILINAAILVYLINLALSFSKSKQENVQAVFVFTAVCWLLVTTALGLILVYNFTYPLLSNESLSYLPLHAHLGIIGWFLLLIMGVGSRLIPMFLISTYENTKLLWHIYALINGGLLSFIGLFIYFPKSSFYLVAISLVVMALLLFGYYIYQAYKQRIRKHIDRPVKISLLSVLMTVLPLMILFVIMAFSMSVMNNTRLILTYGFTIFFGSITAIILGMTFKTLPFIVWNKVYHEKAGLGKTPDPKELFDQEIFAVMAVIYIAGFILFAAGIMFSYLFVLKSSAILLLVAALLYNLNVFKIIKHRPALS
ncbi:cytochrome C oxidase subunit I [Terrimonas pollutisoli]|uniref:cytochrome C oxidase subunit I n=1 Tax=Terrimonas pollutisoli TaxID=3034147 RepID=UPI0023EBD008|nr:cytochrome C oxidase subunit I [Terrimonas sp. H1YJ31]